MAFKEGPSPDTKWFSIVNSWLEENGELIVSFTFANSGGAGGYIFCASLDDVNKLVSMVPDATRLLVYRKYSPLLRGVVDESMILQAKKDFPKNSDALLISLEELEETFGYDGFNVQNPEELEEYLRDLIGENVLICIHPADECIDEEQIVSYKGGIRGAY